MVVTMLAPRLVYVADIKKLSVRDVVVPPSPVVMEFFAAEVVRTVFVKSPYFAVPELLVCFAISEW